MKKILQTALIAIVITCSTTMLHAQDTEFCTRIKSVYSNLTAANLKEAYNDYFTDIPGWEEASKYRPGGMFGNYYTYMLSYKAKSEKDAQNVYNKLVSLFGKCLDAKHTFNGKGYSRDDSFDFSDGSVSLTQTNSTEAYNVNIMVRRRAQ
jgi:hypothetical protein